MENKKYGWSTFERYYYNQLNRFKNATLLYVTDTLTENSSLEEISTRFDELIDFLEVSKNIKLNMNIKNQIEHRLDLLSYFISKKAEAIMNNLPINAWDTLINITTSQLENLISKETELFFTTPLNTNTPSQKLPLKKLNELIKDMGFFPIDTETAKGNILVIEMNYLPSNYKSLSIEEARQKIENEYGYKVLFIDSSRVNTQTNSNSQPVYFI